MDVVGLIHTGVALAALVLGLAVVLCRKGTTVHRRTGRLYVGAMLLLNGTALAIYDLFGFFGPFHFAAVVSLGTIGAGLYPIYTRRPRGRWIERHAYFMAWSYAGLVAALMAELAVRVPGLGFGWAVLGTLVVAVTGAAFIIHTRVPSIVSTFGGMQRPPTIQEASMDETARSHDLTAIRRLMEESQCGVYESGKHYVLWGVLMAAGLCLTYVTLDAAPGAIPWIWGACLTLAWVANLWLGSHEAARAPVDSLVTRTLAGIWVGCGVGMTLIGVLGLYTGAVRPGALPAVIASVLGAGYFASSFAYRSVAVRALGAAWWLGAIGLFFWPGPPALLVLAGLLLVLQVVPGVVFYRRAKLDAARSVA